jgi:hypothetical protein
MTTEEAVDLIAVHDAALGMNDGRCTPTCGLCMYRDEIAIDESVQVQVMASMSSDFEAKLNVSVEPFMRPIDEWDIEDDGVDFNPVRAPSEEDRRRMRRSYFYRSLMDRTEPKRGKRDGSVLRVAEDIPHHKHDDGRPCLEGQYCALAPFAKRYCYRLTVKYPYERTVGGKGHLSRLGAWVAGLSHLQDHRREQARRRIRAIHEALKRDQAEQARALGEAFAAAYSAPPIPKAFR